MTRLEQESTARMDRNELAGLLHTMEPAERQPITARMLIPTIEEVAIATEPLQSVASDLQLAAYFMAAWLVGFGATYWLA